MESGFSVPILFTLFAVFYWVMATLLESKRDYKFAFTEFAKGLHVDSSIDSNPSNSVKNLLSPLIGKIRERVTISEDKEEQLKRKLKDAAVNSTPQEFMMTKVLYAMGFSGISLVLFALSVNLIFLILSIGGLLVYFYPDYTLNKRIQIVTANKKLELPEYLIPLGLLMYSQTAHQAVKHSIDHAGPFLRPHVERLIADLEMYPGSDRPFRTFAENVNVMEAQIFITALQQSMNTDAAKSREIIEKQNQMMRKLREENYLSLIAKKPLQMNKYNVVVIFCMIIIPMSIVVIELLSVFNNM